MKYAIYFLMFICLLMESRVGEFNPTNRMIFNVSFYLFSSVVIWIQSGKQKRFERIVFRFWSGLFAYWTLSEIVHTFSDTDFFDFSWFIAAPLIIALIIEKWN